MSYKIIFFGNECLSSATDYTQSPIFQSLIHQNYDIEALIIKNNPTKSRNIRQFNIVRLAEENDIPIFKVSNSKELEHILKTLNSKMAILASFGLLIPDKIINHFPLGIVNVHPSLLPKYRGTTPIETTILNGDKTTGVSLMRLSSDLDAGAIYIQKSLEVEAIWDKLELTTKLGQLAAQLIKDNIEKIISKKIAPKPQINTMASYTQPIKSQLNSDFQTASAKYWHNFIKAYKNCANNKFLINDIVVNIFETKPTGAKLNNNYAFDKKNQSILIKCQTDTLEVKKIKPANGKLMDANDFINGFFKDIIKI